MVLGKGLYPSVRTFQTQTDGNKDLEFHAKTFVLENNGF